MANLVIPMAGQGSRFSKAGYMTPKPLLQIFGVPLYELVFLNLWDSRFTSVTFAISEDFPNDERERFVSGYPSVNSRFVTIKGLSRGPADTVQQAIRDLDQNVPLVTANSDQFIFFNKDTWFEMLCSDKNIGAVMTMHETGAAWSYVKRNNHGHLSELREKQEISDEATTGVYGFRSSKVFLRGLERMRLAGDTTNDEDYVGPIYNYLDLDKNNVKLLLLDDAKAFVGLGVPSDYEKAKSRQDISEFIRVSKSLLKS